MRIIVVLMLVVQGCNLAQAEDKQQLNPYNMSCIHVGTYIVRCENFEAVCYSRREGISCLHKRQQEVK